MDQTSVVAAVEMVVVVVDASPPFAAEAAAPDGSSRPAVDANSPALHRAAAAGLASPACGTDLCSLQHVPSAPVAALKIGHDPRELRRLVSVKAQFEL